MKKQTLVLASVISLLASEVFAEMSWRIVDKVPRVTERQLPFLGVDLEFPKITIDIVPMRKPKESVIVEIPANARDITLSDGSVQFGPPSLDLVKDIAKGARCRIIRAGGFWYEFDEAFEFERLNAITFQTFSLPSGTSGTPEEIRKTYFKHQYVSCIRHN